MLFLCYHKFRFWTNCLNVLNVNLSSEIIFMTTGSLSKDWCISVVQYCIYKVTLMDSEKMVVDIRSFFIQLFLLLKEFKELYTINKYEGVSQYLSNILKFYDK